MAFTFDVETGTGSATSNSYATVAEADDYFDVDRVFEATWDALSTAEKEDRLAWATRILDQKVSWRGSRTSTTQALAWPRRGVYNRWDEAIDLDEIPEQLKQATFELAKYIQTNDATTGQGVDYIKSVTLDVLQVEYQEGTSQTSFPHLINSILRGLGHYNVPGTMAFGSISKT